MSTLPTGTVTFLFTDIEGSTRLVAALGNAFGPLLERHHALLRTAFGQAGGIEVSTEGDAFFVVFRSPADALRGAVAAQRALAAETWPAGVPAVKVRMGVHTGEGTLGGDNYVGMDVHLAARIAAAAHGGQVLVSAATGALVATSPLDELSLRDLGEHRLKDIEAPERLSQLAGPGLATDFPPPRTLEVPSNVPLQATTFVGRDREIAEVVELVQRSRLTTLTGPGGTGKTRLSLEVAKQLEPVFTDGVFFVELDAIVDPALIPSAVAGAVGLREDPARPILESLVGHLRDRHVLLVLDNFEQVIAGASVVRRLLQAAPHVAALVSSRETLHLAGEQEYPVPPLSVPDLGALPTTDALAEYEAVALFVERARATVPSFALTIANATAVAGICVRLDGLPLAIELAAARVKLFTPDAILARLTTSPAFLSSTTPDLPERQRTLRGAVAWSHDLLDPTEQALFRRLAMFVGGWTIESAEAVCDPARGLGIDVLDALSAFVDKSLVRSGEGIGGEPRFRMLETIRDYARERLQESPDAAVVRRGFEDHFAALARRAEPELLGSQQKAWLDRVEAEHDNLRAAMRLGEEDGRIDVAIDMAAAIWRFWQQRGHLAEGKATLSALLESPAAAGPTPFRARGLGALGGIVYWQGDVPGSGTHYEEALAIERQLDDPAGLAEALYNAGFANAFLQDPVTAEARYAEALAIRESLGDENGVTAVRQAIVILLWRRGEFAAARDLQAPLVAAFRSSGERFRLANALMLVTAVSLGDHAPDAARAAVEEAFGIFRAAADHHAIVRCLTFGAMIAIQSGDPERAAMISGAADVIREPLGTIGTQVQILGVADPAVQARETLGDAAYDAAYRRGRALDLDALASLIGQ